MSNARTPVYLRRDQWETIVTCLTTSATAIDPGLASRTEKMAYNIARSQIDSIVDEIRRTALKEPSNA